MYKITLIAIVLSAWMGKPKSDLDENISMVFIPSEKENINFQDFKFGFYCDDREEMLSDVLYRANCSFTVNENGYVKIQRELLMQTFSKLPNDTLFGVYSDSHCYFGGFSMLLNENEIRIDIKSNCK